MWTELAQSMCAKLLYNKLLCKHSLSIQKLQLSFCEQLCWLLSIVVYFKLNWTKNAFRLILIFTVNQREIFSEHEISGLMLSYLINVGSTLSQDWNIRKIKEKPPPRGGGWKRLKTWKGSFLITFKLNRSMRISFKLGSEKTKVEVCCYKHYFAVLTFNDTLCHTTCSCPATPHGN